MSKVRTTVVLEEEQVKILKEICKTRGVTMSEVVDKLITEYNSAKLPQLVAYIKLQEELLSE